MSCKDLFVLAMQNRGRKKKFPTPGDLAEAIMAYFEWCDNNPIIEKKLVSYQGESVLEDVPHDRPYTHGGLYVHADIAKQTWYEYANGKYGEEYADICAKADEVMFKQKFDGAAVNMFNSNIIARDLGLKDRSDVTSDDKALEPTVIERRIVRTAHAESDE